MRMIEALNPHGPPKEQNLLRDLRALWLSDIVTRETLEPLLTRAKVAVPRIGPLAERLLQETLQAKTLPQYHDNIYGRKFESELARRLVEDPPAGVLKAVNSIRTCTLAHVDALPPERRDAFANGVLTHVEEQPRQWFAAWPEIARFRAQPSVDSLKATLGSIESGIDILKVMYLSHRTNLVLSTEESGPEHLKRSDRTYVTLIKPQRGAKDSVLRLDTNGYGIGLVYHPLATTYPDFQPALCTAYLRTPILETPTPFIRNTLQSGAIYVNDLSGNAAMWLQAMKEMQKGDPEFSLGDGLLALCIYIGFNGGHSHQDVLATIDGINALERSAKTLADRDENTAGIEESAEQAAAEEFGRSISPYDRLAQLPAASADQAKVRQMLNAALDDTVAYCRALITDLGMPNS